MQRNNCISRAEQVPNGQLTISTECDYLTRSQVSSIVRMLNDDDEMRELRENLYFTERKIYEHMFEAVSTLMCANCVHLTTTMPELKLCRLFHSICVCVLKAFEERKSTFFALFISMSFSCFPFFYVINFHEKYSFRCRLPIPIHKRPYHTLVRNEQPWNVNCGGFSNAPAPTTRKQFLLRWNMDADMAKTMCVTTNASLVFPFGRHLSFAR